ncbi:uncharacterized protein LOC116591889 [Mustela erminea]|uniref:uncharacterized protein LOC116591889 n=1 Tax=Mustela erminea TaxID=36723 RepID=UPI00138706B2|nr:uncharacterized protein LOC116591889 [Mustela erminea]
METKCITKTDKTIIISRKYEISSISSARRKEWPPASLFRTVTSRCRPFFIICGKVCTSTSGIAQRSLLVAWNRLIPVTSEYQGESYESLCAVNRTFSGVEQLLFNQQLIDDHQPEAHSSLVPAALAKRLEAVQPPCMVAEADSRVSPAGPELPNYSPPSLEADDPPSGSWSGGRRSVRCIRMSSRSPRSVSSRGQGMVAHPHQKDGSENAVWAWCQALVFHSSDRLTDELWEAGGRLSLRVPLLWRHSWAEQDLLQTTTRETESIWFNRCPSRQAPEELAANPAMLEASSAAQPISDITGYRGLQWPYKEMTQTKQASLKINKRPIQAPIKGKT